MNENNVNEGCTGMSENNIKQGAKVMNESISIEAKKEIIDLVNKIKYVVTPEQMAELSGCAMPLTKVEFVDWHAKIDGLNFNRGPSWMSGEMVSQLRALLHRIADLTKVIGKKVVPVGRRIIKWIFSLIERFPETFLAAIILSALCWMVASITIIGLILLPIMKIVAACLVCYVFLREFVRGIDFNQQH